MNIPYKTERETKTPLFSLNLRKNKVTTIHTLEDKQNKQFFYEFPENKNKYKCGEKKFYIFENYLKQEYFNANRQHYALLTLLHFHVQMRQ